MRIQHILKSQEFTETIKNAKKVRGHKVVLYIEKRTENKGLKIGIIIPKKAVPLAVKRNYLRRRIYAFFRENEIIDKNHKIIVKITQKEEKKAKKETFNAVQEEMQRVLAKEKLI